MMNLRFFFFSPFCDKQNAMLIIQSSIRSVFTLFAGFS